MTDERLLAMEAGKSKDSSCTCVLSLCWFQAGSRFYKELLKIMAKEIDEREKEKHGVESP